MRVLKVSMWLWLKFYKMKNKMWKIKLIIYVSNMFVILKVFVLNKKRMEVLYFYFVNCMLLILVIIDNKKILFWIYNCYICLCWLNNVVFWLCNVERKNLIVKLNFIY